MSLHQVIPVIEVNEFQKQADDYLQRAAEAVDPQDQRMWLNLARDCLRIAADAEELRR
jgi:hypothetical protein